MSQTITPDILAEPPEPDDSGAWDFERGMSVIRVLREENRQLRATTQRYKNAVAGVLGGHAAPEGIIVQAPPAAPGADLAAVAAALGVDSTNPADVLAAAVQSRLSGEMYGIFAETGVDPILTRAMLNQSRALADIDLSASDVHDQLSAIVADTVKAHPNLRVRRDYPSTSSAPMPGGSGGAPTQITREELQWMKPEQVVAARKAGLLTHLNAGKD